MALFYWTVVNLIILTFWSKTTCFQPFCLKAEGVTPFIFLKNLVR